MDRLSKGEISDALYLWTKEIGIPLRDIMYTIDNNNVLTIYTDIPGQLIGKAGSTIDKLKQLLNVVVDKHNQLVTQYNAKEDKEFELTLMSPVSINFIEVTRGDYWFNYDWYGRGM